MSGGGVLEVAVVVLAGGRGERFGAETGVRPKPLIEIGGRPILGHLLAACLRAGFRRFVVASGYRAPDLHAYLRGAFWRELDRGPAAVETPAPGHERVRCGDAVFDVVDTGEDTANGGRLRRLAPLLDATFVLTWADVLSDLDLAAMLAFHRERTPLVTVAAVHPPLPFGLLTIGADQRITCFVEKPGAAPLWVNGGVFVVEQESLAYLADDSASWEHDALPRIAASGGLAAFPHEGFWRPMDTPRDRDQLERIWSAGTAPWAGAE